MKIEYVEIKYPLPKSVEAPCGNKVRIHENELEPNDIVEFMKEAKDASIIIVYNDIYGGVVGMYARIEDK